MSINILDSMIINRISAGEVVESPFSIVKELLDNALDAGANNLYVEIKNGGIDSIIVKDNGKGIEYDDIKKAFLPHATSKIKNIEDLDSITTLGFRGEALASISNVSQTAMITKTANSDVAYKINVFGGEFSHVQPTSSDVGTKVEVNNLFYNTPVRRKFLKKPKQEENQITNVVSRYILAHPEIAIKYVVDGKTIFNTKGGGLLTAINCVYDNDISQNVVYIEKQLGNLKLSGYVSKIGFSKPNTTYQTLMINSRYVVNETVSKAAYMAYEEYLMPRQFPVFILNLDMPNSEVDVNVHPSKMDVKFANTNEIYSLVYSAIRSAIYKMINPVVEPVIQKPIEETLIKTDIDSLKEISIEPTGSSTQAFFDEKLKLKQEFVPTTIFDEKHEEVVPLVAEDIQKNQTSTQENEYQDIGTFLDYKIIGTLFDEFIILEKDENMLLLDFHAGHERLNYDKFTKMVNERKVVVQDLLVPYTQSLTAQEISFIMELKPELNELGFDINEFSDKQIIISSVPMQLKDINLKLFIDDLLHDMKNLKPEINNEIRHYLMQKACKSSVKSGMTLTEMEIKELLKNLDLKHPVLLCPHGRPIVTVVTRAQVEKWFKRIV